MKQHTFAFVFLLCVFCQTFGQQDSTALRNAAPKVFLLCNCWGCDLEYYKNQLTFLNFMRDRSLSDVNIVLSCMQTGSGGTEYVLNFQGEKRFIGQNDTLKYYADADDTQGQIRDGIMAKIRQGMIPFLMKTPLADKITFSFPTDSSANSRAATPKDKWNLWTYSLSANAYVNGQQISNSLSSYSTISANQISPKHKTTISYNFNYNRSSYETSTGKVVGLNVSHYFEAIYVKSLGEHWSVGGFARANSSTFNNMKYSISLQPALEYDIYPYSEATRRQVRFLYRVGAVYNNYVDTTIFGETKELLGSHSLEIAFKQVEDWGNVNVSLSGGNYLHNWKLNYVSLSPDISWNIFKGFTVNFGGYFSIINNQISLAGEGPSDPQILLQITQLKTNYSYWGYGGFSYVFGSIYNNVVNPRFGQ